MSDQSTTTTDDGGSKDDQQQQQESGGQQRSNGIDDVNAMRQALAKANEEAKKYRLEAKDLRTAKDELDKLRESAMTEHEKAVAQARSEGKSEALKTVNGRLVQATVEAVAAGKMADPSDAVAMLDLEKFAVDDDGKVDRKAIGEAIDKLIAKKPYLAGSSGGSFDGGARGGSGSKTDMNSLIRERMRR